MKTCDVCGGIKGTEPLEKIAGTPCRCESLTEYRPGMTPEQHLKCIFLKLAEAEASPEPDRTWLLKHMIAAALKELEYVKLI